MSSVDDRIVNMKFNNAQFSQGVDKSKRDLTGLEKTITNAGKSKGMTDLGSSVQQVSTKFSALQVAGTVALGTIVAKATSAGLSLVKKLTIQPLIDGFKEYQTNLDSVQTIMANTGKKVGVVNRYLEELNKYSDQTIYNFSQMAKNIGTFTAAGVKLDTATSAIKGISNLAALSGSSAQQASTAMYQLSQAISAGRVNLQDWNSVVNAGMGGKQFKSALARTAVAMGQLSADAVKVGTDVEIMGESFRTSISAKPGEEGWLNSDVLVKTLAQLDGRFSESRMKIEGYNKASDRELMLRKERNKLAKEGIVYSDKEFKAMVKMADASYAAATQIKTFPQLMDIIGESIGSMWANAFSIVLGDFEESKKLWGAVGDAIVGPDGVMSRISGSFLGMLRDWKAAEGRDMLLKGFERLGKGVKRIFRAITGAWQDVFPPGGTSLLLAATKAFKRLTLIFKPGLESVEDFRSIFGGLFAILHLGLTILKGVAGAFSGFFKALFKSSGGARSGVLGVFAAIGEVLMAIDKWLTAGGKLEAFMTGIGTVLGAALSPVISVIGLIMDGFGSLVSGKGLGGAMDSFREAKDIFGGFVSGIITGLDQLTAPFDGVKSKIADLAQKMAEPFQPFVDALEDARLKLVTGLGLDKIAPTTEGLTKAFEDAKTKVVDFVNSFSLASVPIEDFGAKIRSAIDWVKEFVKEIDFSDKIENVRGSVSEMFSGMFGDGSGASKAAGSGADAMAATAGKTGAAFEKLGDIMSSIGGGIKAVFGFIGDVIGGIVDALSNIPFPDDAIEWATVLNYIIGGAIIKKLLFSKGTFETLRQAIRDISDGVQDSFGQLTDTLKTMQGAIKSEIIKNIAIAVALLVASLIALSFIPQDKLATGIGALGAVMGMAYIMMSKLLGGLDGIKSKELTAKATAMLALGAAMVMMATAVAILVAAVLALAFLPLEKLAVGLTGVAVLLGIMVVALKQLSGNSAKIAAAGAAMLLMAMAIDILVLAVLALAFIPMENLATGLVAIAVGMAIMVGALKVLAGNSTKILAAGGAMVMIALAMDILVVAITTLGLLPWDVVTQGLKAIAIGMGIMVLALLVLAGAGPSVMAAGAAMIMMAIALNILMTVLITLGTVPWKVVEQGLLAVAIGLGILLLAGLLADKVAPGLAVLSTTILSMGAAMLMAGAGMFLFATGLAILAAVGAGAIAVIVLAIQAFIALLPSIAIQVAAAFVSFIGAIAAAAPKIRKHMVTIGTEMLGTIRDLIPEVGKLFDELLNTAINSIENAIPRFVEMGFTIIDEFLKSADAHIPSIIDSAVSLVSNFVGELGRRVGELAQAGLDLVVDVLNGISDAIENSDRVRDAAWKLVRTFADEVREAMADLFSNINPLNYLPDVSIGDLKSLLPGRGGSEGMSASESLTASEGAKGKKANAYTDKLVKALSDAATVISNAVALFVGAEAGPLFEQVAKAKELDRKAIYQRTKADSYRAAADVAFDNSQSALDDARGMKNPKKDDKSKKAQKQRKLRKAKLDAAKKAITQARQQQRQAAVEEQKAIIAQQKADYEDQKARDAVTYKDDPAGLGAARASVGEDLADASNALAATAQAKVDEAIRLEKLAAQGGKNAGKYRKEAARLRKEAAAETAQSLQLSAQAIEAQEQAVAAYAAARKQAALEVISQMGELRTRRAEEQAQREWETKYEAETDQGKIDMLNARLLDNESKAKAAQAALANAYAQSDAVAAEIAAGRGVTDQQLADVQKALIDADKAAADAEDAMNQIDSDKRAIQQLQEKITQDNASGGSSTGSGPNISPSRTALEDAMLAVDRYTASVAQAEEYASAASSTTQFIQNNYSPEALSASEVYRQTNNLISAAEIKMGV